MRLVIHVEIEVHEKAAQHVRTLYRDLARSLPDRIAGAEVVESDYGEPPVQRSRKPSR